MDKITKEEYNSLPSCEEKQKYVTEILGIQGKKVGGKVDQRSGRMLFITLYHPLGEPAQMFSDPPDPFLGIKRRALRLPAMIRSKENHIVQNDYVLGDLIIGINKESRKEELQLSNVKKMKSFEELKREMFASLKERWQEEWQREGFTFDEEEIVKFDGEMKFGEWVLKEVSCKLETSYGKFIQEKMKDREQELRQIQEKIDELKTQRQEAQEAFDGVDKKNREAQKEYQKYVQLGIIPEEEERPGSQKLYDYTTYKQLVQDVWSYLWKQKNLYYEQSIVKQFLNALRTRQLILLWGKPGTGKTSLPRGVAEALGAKCVRVQVQSNWTDNQDLLGFYNIVEKRYVPTQFLEALVKAKKQSNRLYLILLDEMNLSKVEYYFSEMLNVFTWDEAYTLHLYPKKNLEDLKREREFPETQGEEKEVSRLNSRLREMMNDYTPDFEIPPNVRFVGTLNADATTKIISPKVIDRSALIELEAISGETKRREEKALPEATALDGKRQVPARQFEIRKLPPQGDNPIRPVLEEIRELLKEAGLSVSNRLDAYADQWLGWEDSEAAADEIVLEKVLPILNIQYTGENKETLKRLRDEILEKHGCEKSLAKLLAMEEKATNGDWIRYWEN